MNSKSPMLKRIEEEEKHQDDVRLVREAIEAGALVALLFLLIAALRWLPW